jgi:hypothetical protein
VEIFWEAGDFGIADVGAVQERHEVKQAKPWYQFEIEFPYEFAILNTQLAGHWKQVKTDVGTILARSSALSPSSGSGISPRRTWRIFSFPIGLLALSELLSRKSAFSISVVSISNELAAAAKR